MANNIYTIDLLATGTETVTITDDGTGIDWLVFSGVYDTATSVSLNWTSVNDIATSASGFYFNPGNTGHRLVVNGLIENVRGSNGVDFIQGNSAANLLFGDNAATGAGLSDTIWGQDGNDTIYGGSGNDSIGGDGGNDVLFGNSGADTISGGAGRDTVMGGVGADSLSGGADGHDVLSYRQSGAGVTVVLTAGSTTAGSGGEAQGDQINGFGDVLGSEFADRITDSVQNTIAFGYNDNNFYGFGGNDVLNLGGGADRGTGGDGNDTINGGVGNDTLAGEAGADQLIGGLGLDRLIGGLGADMFVFNAASHSTVAVAGRDVIHDFNRVQGDKIDLRGIDADPALALNQAFIFNGSAAFDGRHGLLRATASGVNMLVTADLNGDQIADFSILVLNSAGLLGADFLL